MSRSLLIAAFLPAFASAQDAAKPPAGQPSFLVVSSVDDAGILRHVRIVSDRVAVTVYKVVRMGQVTKEVPATEYRTVKREVSAEYDLRKMKLRNLKGEPVSFEAARKRIVAATLVMVAQEGMKLDPAYLRILARIGKEDTLVLWQPAAKPK